MRANLGEPVEVWLRDGTPARFVWRDRRYTVMFVVERHFVPAAPLVTTDAPPAEPTVGMGAAGMGAAGTGAAGTGAASAAAASAGAGNDCWRVEATPERTLPPARYELCHDLAADRWSLSRD